MVSWYDNINRIILSLILDLCLRNHHIGFVSSREQLWNFYIKKPMILVGPSLGAAVAIDFAVNHPEAVSTLDD